MPPRGKNQCHQCLNTFRTKSKLKQHIQDEHKDLNDHEDAKSQEKFNGTSETVIVAGTEPCTSKSEALPKVAQENLVTCFSCYEVFPNKNTLFEHMETHMGAKRKPIVCEICQKTFSRKYHLDRHLTLTACSGQIPPSHICHICEKTFTRKDNLRDHLRAHASDAVRPKKYICNFCNKKFQGACHLKIHIRTHTGEKPFSCDFCAKCFSSESALNEHRRVHTGEKPYVCDDCGIRFSLKGTLNRHNIRVHNKNWAHKCEYCDKEFALARGLKTHMFYHTGENGCKCSHCGKLYNGKDRLQMHIRLVHEKIKPFKCSECEKSFTRKEDLIRHNLSHSGDKPHECPTCKKRFSIKPSLKMHMLTHLEEEPRFCQECGHTFKRKDCLLRHMRKRHRDTLNKLLQAEKEASVNDCDSPHQLGETASW